MRSCVEKLSASLRKTALTLDPVVKKQKTRGSAGVRSGRDFQRGFCWSFAEGIGLWLGDGRIVSLWVEDWEMDILPEHLWWSSPSGLLLDSTGAAVESQAIGSALERSYEDAAGDVRAWTEGGNSFALRKGGIFPPRKPLVEAVANTMEEVAGPSSSFPCLW